MKCGPGSNAFVSKSFIALTEHAPNVLSQARSMEPPACATLDFIPSQ